MINNPVTFSIDYLADASKDIPNMVVQLSKCQRDRSVASAYQTALKKKDDIAIALALSPFARKTAELVKSGAYEAVAGSCYIIFRCLAKTCKEHENWFCGFTGYGDTYTKLAIFTEAVVELYCHLRQKTGLSKRMADEMPEGRVSGISLN